MDHRRRLKALRAVTILFIAAFFGCDRCHHSAVKTPNETDSNTPTMLRLHAEKVPELERAIETLRRGGKDVVRYVEPTREELDRYKSWITACEEAARRSEPMPSATPPGFRVSTFGDLILLSETEEARRGAGGVVLRKGNARPILIEAPHTFFDVATLPIALTAFQTSQARAFLFNTVHRFQAKSGPPEADSDEPAEVVVSDVAHAERSFFLTAHEVLAPLEKSTFQFHGFRDDVVDGEIVLSASGTLAPIVSFKSSLARIPGTRVLAYPTDTRKLGAMTNVEGASSRARGLAFVHVEMARSLRKRLEESLELREEFSSLLFAPLLRELDDGSHPREIPPAQR